MKCKQEMQRFDCIVCHNLRTQRCLAGYSQQYIGEQLGVTFQQIQKYEKATNRISAGRLWALSQILEIPVETFFTGCGEPYEGVEMLKPTSNEVLLLRVLRQSPTRLQKSFFNMIMVMASNRE
ncbi:MAG: helix-turn-helix transcriptional regulator [Rhizobiales bacterium]|nr:helix-turn-helix transcriptional regulator [Hyphomicrobiales bacterium]